MSAFCFSVSIGFISTVLLATNFLKCFNIKNFPGLSQLVESWLPLSLVVHRPTTASAFTGRARPTMRAPACSVASSSSGCGNGDCNFLVRCPRWPCCPIAVRARLVLEASPPGGLGIVLQQGYNVTIAVLCDSKHGQASARLFAMQALNVFGSEHGAFEPPYTHRKPGHRPACLTLQPQNSSATRSTHWPRRMNLT